MKPKDLDLSFGARPKYGHKFELPESGSCMLEGTRASDRWEGMLGFKPDRDASFWDVFLFQAFLAGGMQVLYALESQMSRTLS